MTLPKSLRPRYRYLFVEVETEFDREVDESGLRRAAWYESQNLMGDLGSAETEVEVLDLESGLAVVRCRRDEVERTRAALACVTEVDDVDVGVRVLGVSGTLRAGRRRYEVDEAMETDVDGRAAVRRGARVDVRSGERHRVICGTTYDFE